MLNKILSLFLGLAIFFSDSIAMDDKPDENVMVLRSGSRTPKTISVNSSLQLQTSQMADDEGQVRKRRRARKKENEKEERGPVKMSPTIPPMAQGHEEIYRRFVNGVLFYRPNPNSDVGIVTLPIRDLKNPLEGTFDLSRCGDTGNYLSISTGYRKGKKSENASKVEIWFAPRFLIEKELNTAAKHFQAIFPAKWNANAPVGMFCTWGGDDNLTWYDYLTTESMDTLSKIDLYENWKKSTVDEVAPVWDASVGAAKVAVCAAVSCFVCELK